MTIDLILLIIAAVCLALVALKVELLDRISLGWLGLFLWLLTSLV